MCPPQGPGAPRVIASSLIIPTLKAIRRQSFVVVAVANMDVAAQIITSVSSWPVVQWVEDKLHSLVLRAFAVRLGCFHEVNA